MSPRDLLAVAGQALAVVAAVALVGVVLAAYFGPGSTIVVVLACAALAGASCAVPLALRRHRALLAGGYVVGFLLVAGVVVRPGAAWFGLPTPALAALVAGDVWHGWNRMLSVNLPADPLPELLALPVLLSWTATFAAVAVAIRSTRPLAPVGPLVAAHLVALLLTAGLPTGHLPATAGLAACLGVLVHLRVRHPLPGRGGPAATVTVTAGGHGRLGGLARTAVAGAVVTGIVGAVTLGALGTAAALPARFDPRSVAPPPVAVRPSVTPLTLVTTQLRRPSTPLFRVRVRAAVPVDRVRTAVLDRYDGATWSSSARFLVAGRVLRAAPRDTPGTAATMSVLLEGWSGPFLPVVGAPTGLDGAVSGERAGYDAGTETLVWSGPAQPGTAYTVSGVVPGAGDGLRSASPAAPGPGDEPPPEVPAALRDAASVLGGPDPPLERLRRLEADLRSRPYSPTTPAGHSFAALEQLATPAAAEGRGDTEQHAAAFALLARLAGFPARVAVGYLLPAAGPDGVHRVTSRDAHAWPEVRFAGHGWIPFEPTDTTHRAPDPAPAPDAVVVPPPPPPAATPVVPPVAAPPNPTRARTFALLAVVASLAVVACAVLGAAAVVGAKAVRRAARRRGSAADRLHGAWAEALDVLTDRRSSAEHRLTLTPSLTPGEIAAEARAAFGTAVAPLTGLASAVTAASFGGARVAAADADAAWHVVAAVRRDLDAGPGRVRRAVRATLDPASLARTVAFRRSARRSLRRLGLEAT